MSSRTFASCSSGTRRPAYGKSPSIRVRSKTVCASASAADGVSAANIAHNRAQIDDRLLRPNYFPSHDGRSFSTSSCDCQRPSRTACRPFSRAASSARRSAASCKVASSGKASIAACAASFTLMLRNCCPIAFSQAIAFFRIPTIPWATNTTSSSPF